MCDIAAKYEIAGDCVTWPAVTHAHESEHHSPQRLDVALLDPLTQYSDALDGEGAAAEVDTTELVSVQTAVANTPMVRRCDMAHCHTISSYWLQRTSAR